MPPVAPYRVPQRPFVLTFRVEEGATDDKLRVDELCAEGPRVDELRVDELMDLDVEVDAREEDWLDEQVPNLELQPVPQCPLVVPHHPYLSICQYVSH